VEKFCSIAAVMDEQCACLEVVWRCAPHAVTSAGRFYNDLDEQQQQQQRAGGECYVSRLQNSQRA